MVNGVNIYQIQFLELEGLVLYLIRPHLAVASLARVSASPPIQLLGRNSRLMSSEGLAKSGPEIPALVEEPNSDDKPEKYSSQSLSIIEPIYGF